MAKTELIYAEPSNYFPKELRKKYGLGEYAKEEGDEDGKKADLKKRKNLPDEIAKRKAKK